MLSMHQKRDCVCGRAHRHGQPTYGASIPSDRADLPECCQRFIEENAVAAPFVPMPGEHEAQQRVLAALEGASQVFIGPGNLVLFENDRVAERESRQAFLLNSFFESEMLVAYPAADVVLKNLGLTLADFSDTPDDYPMGWASEGFPQNKGFKGLSVKFYRPYFMVYSYRMEQDGMPDINSFGTWHPNVSVNGKICWGGDAAIARNHWRSESWHHANGVGMSMRFDTPQLDAPFQQWETYSAVPIFKASVCLVGRPEQTITWEVGAENFDKLVAFGHCPFAKGQFFDGLPGDRSQAGKIQADRQNENPLNECTRCLFPCAMNQYKRLINKRPVSGIGFAIPTLPQFPVAFFRVYRSLGVLRDDFMHAWIYLSARRLGQAALVRAYRQTVAVDHHTYYPGGPPAHIQDFGFSRVLQAAEPYLVANKWPTLSEEVRRAMLSFVAGAGRYANGDREQFVPIGRSPGYGRGVRASHAAAIEAIKATQEVLRGQDAQPQAKETLAWLRKKIKVARREPANAPK